MNARKASGFTLVEIMIVVAIIALLAAIAIPAFANARLKSQRTTCLSHLNQLAGGKDQYALSHNGAAPTVAADLVPEILRRIPVCPAGGSYTLGPLSTDPVCSQAALGHTI